MKLIHTDLNGREAEVRIGFQFDYNGQVLEVTYMPRPHKPSSQGKITCKHTTTGDCTGEYYVGVYDMKWIEREDQSWVHPEVKLRNVLEMYEEMYDDDISGLDLLSVSDMISQVDLEHLKDYPKFMKPMLTWLNENPTPAMLKRQQD